MPIPTNPWLTHPLHRNPKPAPSASFVEYLRWMRILRENPNSDSQIGLVNNGEVLELLDKILSHSDYSKRLQQLTQRTRRIAQFSFEATSNWRLRVGGMRGPESMLLPAFDALGMPYIPSTTLKGVAREMARRELTKKQPSVTEEQIRDIFGEIEPTACLGKVVFLDAYPLPFTDIDSDNPDELEGLVPDMANSIWTWNNNNPQYKTNPNIFLSLRKPTFVIGLRLVTGADPAILEHVKKWLYEALAQGIGSRVNSGYGTFRISKQTEQPKGAKEILSVKFQLRGQLIHGRQNFNNWVEKTDKPEWKPPGIAQSEIRPPAFRSMLRYWFRTLALGVLEPNIVKEWELKIFGGIDPEARLGMFQLEITDGKIVRDNASDRQENCGYATGTLILRQSQTVKQLSTDQKRALQNLLASLTWLTFHLGGIGQGARRPCYSRQNRQYAPWWRGTSVKLISEDGYWNCPSTIEKLQNRFRTALNTFYTNLSTITELQCDPTQPKTVAKTGNWAEAVDSNCRIICVQGNIINDKSPALALLHQQAKQSGNGYDRELCGSINERSPIWIARVGSPFTDKEGFSQKGFDIVTIFGVDNPKRQKYLKSLTQLQHQEIGRHSLNAS
jgi:CRISPR-associated protein Cmr6